MGYSIISRPYKGIHFRRVLATTSFLLVATFLFGCKDTPEPDNKTIQQGFTKHRRSYEDLLKMFQEDAAQSNVSFVNAEHPERTQCDQMPQRHACSLPPGRWEEYHHLLRQLNIISINHETSPDRFYFTTYYRAILMDARVRGVVFCADERPQTSNYHPKQEWWQIRGGWYAFLKIDT